MTPLTARRWSAAAVLSTALVAACQAPASQTNSGPTLSPGSGSLDLAAVCPATIVVQAAWTPEAEHGALYHLLGQTYTIDDGAKKVSGPLVAQGKDTGVKVEIRAGGPAIGFQNAGAQMYADPSIMLGQVATDDAIGLSAKQPVIAVAAPFDLAPYMIMWDPATYPTFNTIVDIGRTDTTVLYFNGATYMDYLTGSGILKRDQVDGSYDGSPTRFLAEKGKVAQQGFATNEPFIYEKALPQWKKKVKFQLIHDTGYPIYPEPLGVRSADFEKNKACFAKLVPIQQQAEVDFIKSPDKANALILDLVNKYNTGWVYSAGVAKFSVDQQLKLGLVGNGPDQTLGNFDTQRVDDFIAKATPIFTAGGKKVKEGLNAQDLVTNEFIDPSIKLP